MTIVAMPSGGGNGLIWLIGIPIVVAVGLVVLSRAVKREKRSKKDRPDDQ